MSIVERIWYDEGLAAASARAALTPASWLFAAGARVNSLRYRFPGAVLQAPLPVLSLGNLSVGGTGKTPIAAWAAALLRRKGAHPAILMRGYGNDEPLVHERLNPDVPVVVDADRVRAAERAHEAGCDCAILDDGFQHRRLARDVDWVLVAAEGWRHGLRRLPAGPLREPLRALERADLVIVTRKSASSDRALAVADEIFRRFPHLETALCHLALGSLVDCRTGESRALPSLRDLRVVAVAAVGAPQAFFAQLRAEGVHVDEHPYRDHHVFREDDVRAITAFAARRDAVVCTLKDAVKLAPLWPAAAAPLWYVSQIAGIERGDAALDRGIETVLAARQLVTSTAGPAGTSSPPNGHRSSTAD